MRISIENAPLTVGQKKEIKAMGFTDFELELLEVIFKDPVAHFRAIRDKMNSVAEHKLPASLEKKSETN